MIQINERMLSGCPVIIEGETGVGKTFLIEIVSCFWNESVLRRWTRVQTRLKERINKLCQKHRAGMLYILLIIIMYMHLVCLNSKNAC